MTLRVSQPDEMPNGGVVNTSFVSLGPSHVLLRSNLLRTRNITCALRCFCFLVTVRTPNLGLGCTAAAAGDVERGTGRGRDEDGWRWFKSEPGNGRRGMRAAQPAPHHEWGHLARAVVPLLLHYTVQVWAGGRSVGKWHCGHCGCLHLSPIRR